MPQDPLSLTIAELERRILRALCGGACDPRDWPRLARQLADYSWREPDHRVVYEALRAIRTDDAQTRRDQLPAQATRLGFPDLDWSLYFEPVALQTAAIEDLIERLKVESAKLP